LTGISFILITYYIIMLRNEGTRPRPRPRPRPMARTSNKEKDMNMNRLSIVAAKAMATTTRGSRSEKQHLAGQRSKFYQFPDHEKLPDGRHRWYKKHGELVPRKV